MHKRINVYCQENVLGNLDTGGQMYMGNLDNRNVFRSDKAITNVMYQASRSKYSKPCCVHT